MNARHFTTTTRGTIEIAAALGARGFEMKSVEVHTPDGRTWNVAAVPAGKSRRADGSWGPVPNAPAGFRLFEVYENGNIDEHDAVDGDTWKATDLLDYLDAVAGVRVG